MDRHDRDRVRGGEVKGRISLALAVIDRASEFFDQIGERDGGCPRDRDQFLDVCDRLLAPGRPAEYDHDT
ncbi:hypothetical protein DSECCO2_594760 [anaerobic digester metagenome]